MAAETSSHALGYEVQRSAGGHFFLDTKFVNVLTFKSSNPVLGKNEIL